MISRLIILLLIVGCEEKDVYGCIDSNAVNFLPNATVSDSTCEYSVYGGYPDFETICGMDEFGNLTENMGDGICELCLGQIEYDFNSGLLPPAQTSLSLPYQNPFNSTTSMTLAVAVVNSAVLPRKSLPYYK